MLNMTEIPMNRSAVWGEEEEELHDDKNDGFPWRWLQWCNTSRNVLRKAEQDLLSFVQTPMTFGNVNIGQFDTLPGEPLKVWTAVLHKGLAGTPLVLVHGFGSGLALWGLNFDSLARCKDRPIYAFDMPGFGQSSRPIFSTDPMEAEEQFIMYIEAWRSKMGLERMILVGHSMGAFLISVYALKHPSRVAHIILADPWGLQERPDSLSNIPHIPPAHRIFVKFLDSLPFNPLWTVRLMGPMGAEMIKRVRMDLISNFVPLLEDAPSKVANYIFHCNVQKPTTGESAFHCMMVTFGWARNPFCHRLHLLHPDIAMTLIYGSRSWVDHFPGELIRSIRPSSYVGYHVIVAGHHVYADAHESFNEIILEACKVDQPLKKKETLTSEDSVLDVEPQLNDG